MDSVIRKREMCPSGSHSFDPVEERTGNQEEAKDFRGVIKIGKGHPTFDSLEERKVEDLRFLVRIGEEGSSYQSPKDKN